MMNESITEKTKRKNEQIETLIPAEKHLLTLTPYRFSVSWLFQGCFIKNEWIGLTKNKTSLAKIYLKYMLNMLETVWLNEIYSIFKKKCFV